MNLLKTLFLMLPLFSNIGQGEVLANYQQGDSTDSHLSRLPALSVLPNRPATPLLAAGPFEVVWSGSLSIDKRQRLHFSFAGSGAAVLSIAGEEILSEKGELGKKKSERLRLNSGEHQFIIRYQSPAEGEARFQLLWEERSFPTEPIPPSAFAPIDDTLATSGLVYRGREIFGRHLCIKCHLSADGFGMDAMPELSHVPPILGLTGDRLHESWLAEWISNPAATRPDTNMPRLVEDNKEGRQQAADLASYLMSLKSGGASPALEGSTEDGGATFHQLACVTCHGLPSETTPSHNRVPLAHLADKFQPAALRDFLLDPTQLSPHTRMPHFRLNEEEASNLASYLLESSSQSEKEPLNFPVGDLTRGISLAQNLHCGACHAGLPYDPAVLPSFERIAQKSWAEAPCYQSKSSHLNLPPDAGAALEALRSKHLDSLRRDTASSLAERQVRNLRCHACHTRDDLPALLGSLHSQSASLAAHLSAAEKLDQSLPRLTHTGEMLHSDYLSEVLAGTMSSRARPWLDARMPGFANHSPKAFAEGMAAQHGLAPSVPEKRDSEPEAVALGKELTGSETGFGCTACHGVGPQEATAAFEVMGINFDQSRRRLRESFFYRWMHDPTRITPDTKMPLYADEKGKTSLAPLDGDSRKQFEAIWDFLQAQ